MSHRWRFVLVASHVTERSPSCVTPGNNKRGDLSHSLVLILHPGDCLYNSHGTWLVSFTANKTTTVPRSSWSFLIHMFVDARIVKVVLSIGPAVVLRLYSVLRWDSYNQMTQNYLRSGCQPLCRNGPGNRKHHWFSHGYLLHLLSTEIYTFPGHECTIRF